MSMVYGLLFNLCILSAISIISSFSYELIEDDRSREFSQGLLFGGACIIGMLNPVVVAPGLIFDGRSVMLSLCGLFFGPLAAAVAALIAIILRVYQGGAGTSMGVLVITSSSLIGYYFNTVDLKTNKGTSMLQLLKMGVVVHIVMVLLMFTLPDATGLSTIRLIGLPVLVFYPLATVLIGKILSEARERRHTIEALIASEETFRTLFNGSSDGILIIEDNVISDCNPAFIKLLEFDSKESIIGKSPWEFSPEMQSDGSISREKEKEIIKNTLVTGMSKFDWTCKRRDNRLVPLEIMLTSIFLNGKTVLHSLCRDVSERNRMEQRLAYLSYHDQLTGLYNRRFFEDELKRLDKNENYPLTIIMADVNGLKLVNDSFGHSIGDELLKKVANAIKKGCRPLDIAARLGGDEFVVLLSKTDLNEAEQIVENIKYLSSREKLSSIDISVSIGMETKYDGSEQIQEILKKAEDHMYKKKLFESPSMRGKTISTIISTLHEKNDREEQHSQRVAELCQIIGQAVGLTDEEVQELKTVGLLHDIGKIAINESILNKPGKLDMDEWAEIKRHPEVGYRILSTVNNMSEMAEFVLAHHERWDGSGYPKGLVKQDIPLQSRIIAIADAYDAMTSERSYRGALPNDVVINELIKNAGVQFDPKLVKLFVENVLGYKNVI